MKLSKTVLPVAAVLSMAAGLLTAVPAQAAVKLPTGCTTQDSLSSIEDIECKTLADGADFSSFTQLSELTIGEIQTDHPSKATLTKLPKLPAQLTSLSLNAPRMTDYSGLASVKNLERLHIEHPNKQLNLSTIARGNTQLNSIGIYGLDWIVDASPLAALKKLESLYMDGNIPDVTVNEGSWTAVAYPKGLDGKAIVPKPDTIVDANDKKLPSFDYNTATGMTRFNSAGWGIHYSKYSSTKPTATQPKLKYVSLNFERVAVMNGLSEWARDKKMKLVLRGQAQVGKTVTAQLSDTSNPFKAYVDAWQWYRNGTAIKGATKASYKLTKSDLGKKITVKATDNKDEFGATIGKTIPYSVTATATSNALYGFTLHKPTISGSALPGKKLTAKFTKWGGSPTRYTYQWNRNGKPIKGATKATYKAANADKGKKLTVTVTGTRKNYQRASSTSAPTSVAKLLNTGKPKISKGYLLAQDAKTWTYEIKASKGKWNLPVTSVKYQWYKNGKAIKGATKQTAVVRTGTFDDKTKFSVKVSVKSEYGSASSTSAGWNHWNSK